MGTANYNYKEKKPVDLDLQIAANYLKYEEKMAVDKIKKTLHVSETRVLQALLPTRADWLKLREESLKNGRLI